MSLTRSKPTTVCPFWGQEKYKNRISPFLVGEFSLRLSMFSFMLNLECTVWISIVDSPQRVLKDLWGSACHMTRTAGHLWIYIIEKVPWDARYIDSFIVHQLLSWHCLFTYIPAGHTYLFTHEKTNNYVALNHEITILTYDESKKSCSRHYF